MPIIMGIAAYAVLSSNVDQVGLDPQVDKQFVVVKPGGDQPTTLSQGEKANPNPAIETVSGPGPCARASIQQQGDGNTSITVTVSGSPVGSPTFVAASNQLASSPVIASDVAIQAKGEAPKVRTWAIPQPFNFTFASESGLQGLKGMDRKVTVRFQDASASDVLKWLTKQNVNFVANVDSLPKTKVTVNLSNVPLSEALDVVGSALGGSWQVKGSTLIFRSGGMMFGNIAMPRLNTFSRTMPFDGQMMNGFSDAKVFNFKMDEKMLKELEQFKGMKGEAFKLDEKALKELKGLKGFKMDEKALKELKEGQMKAFKMDEKAMQQLKEMQSKDWKKFAPDAKAFAESHSWSTQKRESFGFKKVDAEKFLKSVTAAQKDIMKKQGFLKVSDLTDEQKAMLFENPKGDLPKDFTFQLNLNGETVKIKNEK